MASTRRSAMLRRTRWGTVGCALCSWRAFSCGRHQRVPRHRPRLAGGGGRVLLLPMTAAAAASRVLAAVHAHTSFNARCRGSTTSPDDAPAASALRILFSAHRARVCERRLRAPVPSPFAPPPLRPHRAPPRGHAPRVGVDHTRGCAAHAANTAGRSPPMRPHLAELSIGALRHRLQLCGVAGGRRPPARGVREGVDGLCLFGFKVGPPSSLGHQAARAAAFTEIAAAGVARGLPTTALHRAAGAENAST